MSVIRPRKDGGCSECNSPDDLVGRGRCCHIIDGSTSNKMDVIKIQKGFYEVKVNDSSLTIEAQKETIVKFFNEMNKLDPAKQQEIINFLENE